jgi:hypothetical protein
MGSKSKTSFAAALRQKAAIMAGLLAWKVTIERLPPEKIPKAFWAVASGAGAMTPLTPDEILELLELLSDLECREI